MTRPIILAVAGLLLCITAVAQEFEAPKSFAITTNDYTKPTSFALISENKREAEVKSKHLQTQGTPPRIQPSQVYQPKCHFSLKGQRWYFRGNDLAGHVLGTHGYTVRNIFGYTNDQVRRMTRNQLIILHSNAHEWERGRRWRRG